MPIFIKWTEISEGKFLVNYICFDPSILTDEDKVGGILVDAIPPEPTLEANEVITGLFIDVNTISSEADADTIHTNVSMWYEIDLRPLTDAEKIRILELNVKALQTENERLKLSNKTLDDTLGGLTELLIMQGVI